MDFDNSKIKNKIFMKNSIIEKLGLDIVYKLSILDEKYAVNLYSFLFETNNFEVIKNMGLYILNNDLTYFLNDDKNIYLTVNIINKYNSLKSLDHYNLNDLYTKCNKNYLSNIYLYDYVIACQNLYKNKNLSKENILKFNNLMSDILKDKVFYEFDEKDDDLSYEKYIDEILGYILESKISINVLYECLINENTITNLFSIGKFDNNVLNVPLNILGATKKSYINNLYNSFDFTNIIKLLPKQQLDSILIKMCTLLKYNNVLEILKKYNDKDIYKLLICFNDVDLSNVNIDNGKIIYNEDFIKFIIGDNYNEKSSVINKIINDETNIGLNLNAIFNNWDELITRFKSQNLETLQSFCENSFLKSKYIFNPDEVMIENEICNSYIDDNKFQDLTELQRIERLRSVYSKMKHNYSKTIPCVSGKYEDYTYEILKANDPKLFILGTLTNCCFKLGATADDFVEYCALNENGRVAVVKDKNNEIVAMMPMIRNGNLIIVNSIESKKIADDIFMTHMQLILQEIGEKIIELSSEHESSKEQIMAVVVGNYKNKFQESKVFEKVPHLQFDYKQLKTINKKTYNNIENDIYYVATKKGFDPLNVESFEPELAYLDERSNILELEVDNLSEDEIKHINSMYYEKNKKVLNYDNIERIVFSSDWYIILYKNYFIETEILSQDLRAKKEQIQYLKLISEYCNNGIKENYKFR